MLPNTSLATLDTMADLRTHRLSWVVDQDAETETGGTARIVLDGVVESGNEGRTEADGFFYEVGEVELSVPWSDTKGVDQKDKLDTIARMHRTLDTFFMSHSKLFPVVPAGVPLGKLTAYGMWKVNVRIKRNSEPQVGTKA